MNSLSHRYKVTDYSSQSPNHKAENIENKNPNTFWRTVGPCEEACFELSFAPIKIHAIEIITSSTPQIEIEAFNKNSFGEGEEVVFYAHKTDLMTQQSFLKDTETLRVKKLKPIDEEIMKEKNFGFLRVYLYNPYHKQKSVRLGLTSFIIFGIPASLTTQLDFMSTKSIRRGLENTDFHRNESYDYLTEPKQGDSHSFITKFAAQKRNPQKLEEEYSKHSRDNSHSKNPDTLESFTFTKKIKSNNPSKPPSTRKDQFSQPFVDLTLTNTLEQNENNKNNFDNEGSSRVFYDDVNKATSMQIETHFDFDNDDIKKAMKDSEISFELENKNRNQEDFSMQKIQREEVILEKREPEKNEEVEPTQYNKMLDQYADDISAESLEELYNEASNRIEKDGNDQTEPLESMVGEEDYQEAFLRENIEEPAMEIPLKKEIVDETSNKSIQENSNQGKNKYWEYKNNGYGQQMFKLTCHELSQDYIRNEIRIRQESEKGSSVKVTMSSGELLKDIVFSLSGFVDPDRQILRDKAISMGARYKNELFDGTTTHLICSSISNGKYGMAKKFKNKIFIVSRVWIDTCYSQKKRVNEKYYELK